MNIFLFLDLITEYNETYYLFFMNMERINSYKGYVGYSIKELNTTQIDCNIKNISAINKKISSLDLSSASTTANISTFKNNFWIRVFSSGCYYFDISNNIWSSSGIEILEDTNITHTHCQSSHLTTFAGGFVVLPNEINFDYVWANADFT